MWKSKNQFEWTTEISKAGIIIFIAIIALVAALLFFGCSSTETQEQWIWEWKKDLQGDSSQMKLITRTEHELRLEGTWKRGEDSGKVAIWAVKIGGANSYDYHGQSQDTHENKNATNTIPIELTRNQEDCYTGRYIDLPNDELIQVKAHREGAICEW